VHSPPLSVWCAKSLQPSTIVYPREQTVSEEGSLYSMRSRLSPHSALSASGSAPASNSNSLHSRGFTSSSLKSLAHSSSVSSIDRRPSRRSPGEVSPPLSATGRHGHRRSRSSNLPQSQSQSHLHSGIGEPPVHPQPLVQHATATSITTTGTTGSSVTTHTSITDPITGEVGRLSHPAWTGGRDFDYLPEESEPSGDDVRLQPSPWGGGWSSPNHLRVLQNRVAGRENTNSRA
jgi:ribosomal protein L31